MYVEERAEAGSGDLETATLVDVPGGSSLSRDEAVHQQALIAEVEVSRTAQGCKQTARRQTIINRSHIGKDLMLVSAEGA